MDQEAENPYATKKFPGQSEDSFNLTLAILGRRTEEALELAKKVPAEQILLLNKYDQNIIDVAIQGEDKVAIAIIGRKDIPVKELFSDIGKTSTIHNAVSYGKADVVRAILKKEGVTVGQVSQLKKDIIENKIPTHSPDDTGKIIAVIDKLLTHGQSKLPEIVGKKAGLGI